MIYSEYFNILIDKSYNYTIPAKTDNKKLDIFQYLGYNNLNDNQLKKINNETIFSMI